MTYKDLYDQWLNKDLYDQWLNEVHESKLPDLPSWVIGGKTLAKCVEKNDPTMYRRGFSDWVGTLGEVCPICEVCGDRKVDDTDVAMEDEPTCGVCKGTHFECENCGEVKSNDAAANSERGRCIECANPEEIDKGGEA